MDAENREMLGALGLPAGAAILEIGCGTARFARAAASTGMAVTAIDVSSRMLEYLEQWVHAERLPHLRTQHSGFLTMNFPASSFEAVVSGAALHHLLDTWRGARSLL